MLRPFFATVLVLSVVPLSAQQSLGLFDAPMVVLPDDGPPFQALFDFDGDGDLDAVGTRLHSWGVNYEVKVWRNDQGVYSLVYTYTAATAQGIGRNMRVAVGDLDGNGLADFTVAGGLRVETHLSQGNGQFVAAATTLTARLADLACADFDGDGRADLAWLTFTNSQLSVRFATGASVSIAVPGSLLSYARIEVLDVDGDPQPELALWQSNLDQFHLLDVTGAGLVALPPLTAVLRPAHYAYWTSGDVDGDGDTDVMAFELPQTAEIGRVHCFRRAGPATWIPEAPYGGGPAESLADVDGDGDLDGVCCGGGGGTPSYWPRIDFGSYFQVARNTGNGVFATAFGFPGKGASRLAGVADVDGDGDADFVAGACVHYSRGPVTTSPMPSTGVDLIGIGEAVRSDLADVDRDGDPDFAPGALGVAENQGDGTIRWIPGALSGPVMPPGFTGLLPRFHGDFDGDGAPDQVIPLAQGSTFSHMGLFLNNGSGHLGYAGPAAAMGLRIGWYIGWGAYRAHAAVADVDGDLDLDLIANANRGYESNVRCELYLNQGDGTFVPGPTLASERIELVADLDGDGRSDFVTVTAYPGNVQLRLGTGVPSAPFGPASVLFPGAVLDLELEAVQGVDANDDGRMDLVLRTYVASQSADYVSLWCNTTVAAGAPSFAATPLVFGPMNTFLGQVSVADVDGDGRSDLLVGSPDDSRFTVHVYRRATGTGQPLTLADYLPPVSQVLWVGFPADADGDGDVDLIGTDVVRNVQREGLRAGLRRQYGRATAGEAGVAPLLGTVGPFRAGSTKVLRLNGVTGPTPALLAVGLRPTLLPNAPLPGVTLHVDPVHLVALFWPIQSQGEGRAAAEAELRFFLPPVIQGLDFFEQVFVLDPAGPGSVAASNGLWIHVGG